MPLFSNEADPKAHSKFVNWIESNPTGFVINRKDPQDIVLHSASCGHFKPYDWANQATNAKACALDRTKLEHWAEVEGIDRLKLCCDCM